MAQDKVTNLYNAFVKNGYAMESEAQFRENLKDPKKRRAAYDALVADGYSMEPFADFESNIGFGTPAPKPASQQQTSQTTAAPTSSSAPVNPPTATAEQASATVQSAPEQPAWQPTEQDKLQTSYELHTMLNDFNRRSRERVEQAQRLTEPLTAEGRKKRRVIQGQVIGSPKKLPGITPPAVAPSSNDVEGDAQQPTIQSGQSPVPYGVKYVNGKPIAQWLLPDGRLTTDITEADQAEYGARAVRLRKQFEERMKQNGLDPAKAEDVQRQTILERLDNNRRMQLEKDRELGEDAAKEWEWDAEAGFFDNIGRLARNSIMRSEGVKFGSEIKEEADADMHNMKAENYMLSKALKRLDAGRLKKSDGILGGMFDVGGKVGAD